jgi:hypothetical protein
LHAEPGVEGIGLHQKLVERLTAEFGAPHSTLRWSITHPGRAPITVQVDGKQDGCAHVKVWVFNPARGSAAAIVDEVSCDGDLERLIGRIKADLQQPNGW